jgi:hypothetical protein
MICEWRAALNRGSFRMVTVVMLLLLPVVLGMSVFRSIQIPRGLLSRRLRVSGLGVDGQQYNAQRKLEARRPQFAIQRSAASVGWAVLDGQEPTLASDSLEHSIRAEVRSTAPMVNPDRADHAGAGWAAKRPAP